MNNLQIISGPVGSGKTTRILNESKAVGLEVVVGENPKSILSDARHPSFLGKGRIALLEAEYYKKSQWKVVADVLKASPPSMVIEVQHIETVPWNIRKQAKHIYHHAPTKEQLSEYLRNLSHHLGLERSETAIESISNTCKSWLTAKNELLSFGTGSITQGIVEPNVAKAILTGLSHPSQTVHPIAVLKGALYNGENPNVVNESHLLHSKAWTTDDLSMVSWDNIKLLRSRTSNYRKTPYTSQISKGKHSYRQA